MARHFRGLAALLAVCVVAIAVPPVPPVQAAPPAGEMQRRVYQVWDLVIPPDATAGNQTREDLLIQLLVKKVAPVSWSDCGGEGTVDYHPLTGALVINQTPEIQKQVAAFLAALRKQREAEANPQNCLDCAPKEGDLPRKQPTPKLCAQLGNLVAGEADASPSPADANEKRDQARKVYQQALRLDSTYLPAYQGLAKLYVALQDTEHAVGTLQAALKHHPKEAAVYFDLGMIYCNRKEWGPALENLTKAAQLEPENRLYVNTLGHAQARAGKPDDALRTYLRVNPEAKAFLNVAQMMHHMNQLDLCWLYLRAALEKDPKVLDGQELLAQLKDSATPQMVSSGPGGATGRSRDDAPTTAGLVAELLRAYEVACADGRTAEAKKLARAALALDPTCFSKKR